MSPCPEVTIRTYLPEDAAALFEAARESLPELGRWMPWAHEGYAIGDSQTWIAGQQRDWTRGKSYQFAILDAGRYAGGCGLNEINEEDRTANLGYWVRRSAQRRGVASVAVRQLVTWAFANTSLNRLEIVAAVENLASQRVAEKAGAHREAILRERVILSDGPHDAVMFAILRKRWPAPLSYAT
jgi:RimJ/RimL family protein N-acetyltransferase